MALIHRINLWSVPSDLSVYATIARNVAFTGGLQPQKCLMSIINNPTCFKNNPLCLNIILTNMLNYFQHSKTFKTG